MTLNGLFQYACVYGACHGRCSELKFTSNLAIHRFHWNKSPLKTSWKRSVGVSRDCPIFWIPHVISGTRKATNVKFCTHILSIDRNKTPVQISGKVAVGDSGTLEIFQVTHVLGASRGRLCDSSAFLFIQHLYKRFLFLSCFVYIFNVFILTLTLSISTNILIFTYVQVCNTLGQCHCDSCFGPPDCSQPGGGGSYHSNPACSSKYTSTKSGRL